MWIQSFKNTQNNLNKIWMKNNLKKLEIIFKNYYLKTPLSINLNQKLLTNYQHIRKIDKKKIININSLNFI